MSRDEAKAKESLSALFSKVDKNSNGSLELSELKRVFGEHADQFLKFCDGDGDKAISSDEWLAGIIGDTADLSEEEFAETWITRMSGCVATAEAADAAMPKVMFVLGGPGAGKGTACERLLEEDKSWAAISAGDCLREERNREGSEHGELINNFIAEGKIVPVEITIALILNKMKACQRDGISKFLIDGFPRSEDNYDGWFAQAGETTTCLGCIFMECPLEVLTERIVGRAAAAEAAGQEVRKDDNLESLQKRFATFKEQSLPIVTRFTEKNQNYEINADGAKDEVYALFKAALANGVK